MRYDTNLGIISISRDKAGHTVYKIPLGMSGREFFKFKDKHEERISNLKKLSLIK